MGKVSSYMFNINEISTEKPTSEEIQHNLEIYNLKKQLGLLIDFDGGTVEHCPIGFNSYGEYDLAKMEAMQYLDNNMEVPVELRNKLIAVRIQQEQKNRKK